MNPPLSPEDLRAELARVAPGISFEVQPLAKRNLNLMVVKTTIRDNDPSALPEVVSASAECGMSDIERTHAALRALEDLPFNLGMVASLRLATQIHNARIVLKNQIPEPVGTPWP